MPARVITGSSSFRIRPFGTAMTKPSLVAMGFPLVTA
jgi:hypothetical protein